MKDILILSPFNLGEIKTDLEYDNVWAETENISEFFNSKKELAKEYKSILFLDGRYNLVQEKLDTLYTQLSTSNNAVAGVYADTALVDSQEVVSYYTNLSYKPDLISQGVFIDSTILIKPAAYPEFDINLSQLMVFDAFLSIGEKHPICRCPSFCFMRNLDCSIPRSELEYIGNKRYGTK